MTYRMKARSTSLGALGLAILGSPVAVGAVPRHVIILRHGEKLASNPYALCDVGVRRSLALQAD